MYAVAIEFIVLLPATIRVELSNCPIFLFSTVPGINRGNGSDVCLHGKTMLLLLFVEGDGGGGGGFVEVDAPSLLLS
jgi:hypothetical protein